MPANFVIEIPRPKPWQLKLLNQSVHASRRSTSSSIEAPLSGGLPPNHASTSSDTASPASDNQLKASDQSNQVISDSEPDFDRQPSPAIDKLTLNPKSARVLKPDDEVLSIISEHVENGEVFYQVRLRDRRKLRVHENELEEYPDIIEQFVQLREDAGGDNGWQAETESIGSDHSFQANTAEDDGDADMEPEELSDYEAAPRRSTRSRSKATSHRSNSRNSRTTRGASEVSAHGHNTRMRSRPRRSVTESIYEESDGDAAEDDIDSMDIDDAEGTSKARHPSRKVIDSPASSDAAVPLTKTVLTQLSHIDACAKCHGSPAHALHKKSKGRKKKDEDDGELDPDEMGCFVTCQTCTFAWHYSCLPLTTQKELKRLYRNDTDAHETFADISARIAGPSCMYCLRSKGTSCMECKETVLETPKSTSGSESDEPLSAGLSSPAKLLPKSKLVELFRCNKCLRCAHWRCLEDDPSKEVDIPNEIAWRTKDNDWRCNECAKWPFEVEAILAWRPINEAAGSTTLPSAKDPDAACEYLVKFSKLAFIHADWLPHQLLFARQKTRLNNFLEKGPQIALINNDEDEEPEEDEPTHIDKFTLKPDPLAHEKIPIEWTTYGVILDAELQRSADVKKVSEITRLAVDPEETIHKVRKIYVKWAGLPYDAATWESAPQLTDPKYLEFQIAYKTFIASRFVVIPKLTTSQLDQLDEPRDGKIFERTVALKTQPEAMRGGNLMPYQLEGLNWLYYQWWIRRGAILADEMGLGKTISCISTISLLFSVEKRQPFLVVVPNSTLSNWMREFKKWAPADLRVVQYNGGAASRKIITEFELFTQERASESRLRAHCVVTTYENVVSSLTLFKRVQRWEAVVIDEAQRLKSGENGQLFKALKQLRIGHKILLTGTPLNNNMGELFHILNFLNPVEFNDLEAWNAKYETLTKDLVDEIQNTLRPYFLRRTKEAVLDLPPLVEMVLPVTMTRVQRLVYRSIFEKNADLIASLLEAKAGKSKQGKKKVVATRKANHNVLMHLRKTVQHPYLHQPDLEPESIEEDQAHKQLVDASSKLGLLQVLLPKLRARGRRVLLFSQFVIVLDILERFLQSERIKFARLDGNTAQVDRQNAIDEFNSPGSQTSVFLLSTRAGGVGINLTTADTVIIFDLDFNPMQDSQAVSRAHRFGQKKKVLTFKLVTKGSCEEKILEAGKKKMVLDHLIVQRMDQADEDEEGDNNIESILTFGAEALFKDDQAQTEVRYTPEDIDALLDKAEAEGGQTGKATEKNKALSYARVWEKEAKGLVDVEDTNENNLEEQRGFWDKILLEQQQKAEAEKVAQQAVEAEAGRKKRRAAARVDYIEALDGDLLSSPGKDSQRQQALPSSDDDFMDEDGAAPASPSGSEGDPFDLKDLLVNRPVPVPVNGLPPTKPQMPNVPPSVTPPFTAQLPANIPARPQQPPPHIPAANAQSVSGMHQFAAPQQHMPQIAVQGPPPRAKPKPKTKKPAVLADRSVNEPERQPPPMKGHDVKTNVIDQLIAKAHALGDSLTFQTLVHARTLRGPEQVKVLNAVLGSIQMRMQEAQLAQQKKESTSAATEKPALHASQSTSTNAPTAVGWATAKPKVVTNPAPVAGPSNHIPKAVPKPSQSLPSGSRPPTTKMAKLQAESRHPSSASSSSARPPVRSNVIDLTSSPEPEDVRKSVKRSADFAATKVTKAPRLSYEPPTK